MIELDIDKASSFTLEMQIDGDVSSAQKPTMRFSIVSEGFTFSVPAKRIDNGIYEVSCPKLKGILKAGDYDVNVEVFIDDKHFVPLKDKIRLKEELKPTVKLAERHEPKVEMTVGVTMKSGITTPTVPVSTITKTAEVITLSR